MRRHRWTTRQVHAAAVRQGDTVLRLKLPSSIVLDETDNPPAAFRAVKRIVHAEGKVCLVGYGNSERAWWSGVAAWLTLCGTKIDVEVCGRDRLSDVRAARLARKWGRAAGKVKHNHTGKFGAMTCDVCNPKERD